MRKRHLLLRAAEIVEKVPKKNFCMSNLLCCSLAHVKRQPGFESLRKTLDHDSEPFLLAGARFFGISLKESDRLFGGDQNYTPIQAAAALRKIANAPPKRKPGTAGMKMVQKAVAEALAVPRSRERV